VCLGSASAGRTANIQAASLKCRPVSSRGRTASIQFAGMVSTRFLPPVINVRVRSGWPSASAQ